MPIYPTQYTLHPVTPPAFTEVSLPGSKSYTNRALLMAALAKGESLLRNALFSDDTERMTECLNQLGVEVQADPQVKTIRVNGSGHPLRTPEEPLYCGNAGTAIRFLAPFCALGDGVVVLTGNERMQKRPIQDLLDGLRQVGVDATDLEGTGCPPIRICGGGLRGGKCRIEGSHSSQYFSALLLSAARMEEGLSLEVEGELVSKPYIDMTLAVMERFGIHAVNEDYHRLRVPPGQEPVACDYTVEGDASAASYFLAAAAVSNGTIRVGPIPQDTCQGDTGFVDVLVRMGCAAVHDGDRIDLSGGPLHGIDVDLNAMSDTAQTLAVVALFAQGPTTIRNIANARIKETDRIAALAQELTRIGAGVEEFPDGLTIHPAETYKPVEIETYDDHRMAMSFAVAGIHVPGLVIQNPGCVSKTFPDFFERFTPWVAYNETGDAVSNVPG